MRNFPRGLLPRVGSRNVARRRGEGIAPRRAGGLASPPLTYPPHSIAPRRAGDSSGRATLPTPYRIVSRRAGGLAKISPHFVRRNDKVTCRSYFRSVIPDVVLSFPQILSFRAQREIFFLALLLPPVIQSFHFDTVISPLTCHFTPHTVISSAARNL